jgi:phage baseplate assembly protein W
MMQRPRYRAWRFRHPHMGSPTTRGLNFLPGQGVEMVDGDESIRQAIYLLLTTRPGERVMRPDYGCPLHRLLFAPNDATTAGLAIHYVQSALDRWEPRIEVLELDASQHPELRNRLEIFLTYRVRSTQNTSSMSFSFELSGEES